MEALTQEIIDSLPSFLKFYVVEHDADTKDLIAGGSTKPDPNFPERTIVMSECRDELLSVQTNKLREISRDKILEEFKDMDPTAFTVLEAPDAGTNN